MEKRLIIEKKGNETIHYFRDYLGFIPFGRKIISEVFQEQENGKISYQKYSSDGSHVLIEGCFCKNPQTGEIYRSGKWNYYDRKFKYHKILVRDETYSDEGGKIEENQWGEIYRHHIIWSEGKKFEKVYIDSVFREEILTDTVNGTRETSSFDLEHGALVRKTIERDYDEKKKVYFRMDSFVYDPKTGRLVHAEHKMPKLRNVYILESYTEGKPPFFEYAEKHYGRYMALYSSTSKEDVYRHYISHLKLSKKDDKIRQKLIATLRTLPTISHRKSFLKEYRFAQMQNFRGN